MVLLKNLFFFQKKRFSQEEKEVCQGVEISQRIYNLWEDIEY
jgi:hypothetical protein